VSLYRRTALFAWLAIIAASAWWTARHVVFTSDLTAFLPAAGGRLERLLVEQLRSGVASRTMLVAIEGGAPSELARLSRELARAIAPDRPIAYSPNGAVVVPGDEARLRQVLANLLQNAGRVILHEDLLSMTWGPEYRNDLQYLRVWVSRLRRKLGESSNHPGLIKTVPGVGYTIREPDEAHAPDAHG